MKILDLDKEELLNSVSTRLAQIGSARTVTRFMQFKLLLSRTLTHVSRDPVALFAISIMGVI